MDGFVSGSPCAHPRPPCRDAAPHRGQQADKPNDKEEPAPGFGNRELRNSEKGMIAAWYEKVGANNVASIVDP